jgi:uncharacterized protein (TIGR02301 family)
MFGAAALLAMVALGGPAGAAQAVRTPDQRQTLIDLAFVLGEAHALHRVCAGPSDDTWRGRMQKLLEMESPPEALKTRLTDSFNAGFSARDAQAKDCRAASALEAGVARRGADLARRLSQVSP